MKIFIRILAILGWLLILYAIVQTIKNAMGAPDA